MKCVQLTPRLTRMLRIGHNACMRGGRSERRPVGALVLAVFGALGTAGCITVNAPDKPIVIELNINITQEVIYRLADDVRENIDANPEIF